MPIVDISGFTENENVIKIDLRRRIQVLYHERLGVPLAATTVTFITDDTTKEGGPVMARLYSKKLMDMNQADLDALCDEVVEILEDHGGHDFNEAFPVPVMAMRGGNKPYKPT
jgi:hypothetical protein